MLDCTVQPGWTLDRRNHILSIINSEERDLSPLGRGKLVGHNASVAVFLVGAIALGLELMVRN